MRQERVDGMRDATSRLPRDIRNRIGVSGRVLDADIDADELQEEILDNSAAMANGYKAWFKAKSGNYSSITQDEHKAAKQLGFHPMDQQLRIVMMDDDAFQIARNIYEAELENIQDGRRGRARAGIQREIRNALSTQTGTGAPGSVNYLFGSTFMMELTEAELWYGGIYGNVDVIRTTHGNPIYLPSTNDTANRGRMLTEALAVPPAAGALVASANPTFGTLSLGAYIGTSDRIAISNSLLQDNSVNLARKIPEMLGMRLGRLKNRMATVGTGTAQPFGMAVQAVAVQAAGVNGIGFDEIMDLTHTVDPAIRERETSFSLHDQTLKLFRKLKDSEGRYLWQIDIESGARQTLDGQPYHINQDLPQVGTADNRSVIYGDHKAYKWRDVVGGGNIPDSNADESGIRLRVLTELGAESDQTYYLAFCRFDGKLLNPGDNPLIALEH
jgi:HK97 family phage major capsid protein